jgi:hypothetical protein
MFKVGEKSESVSPDRDGSRDQILVSEALHEHGIHHYAGYVVLRY